MWLDEKSNLPLELHLRDYCNVVIMRLDKETLFENDYCDSLLLYLFVG